MSASVVLALHGLAVAGLLSYQPTREALIEARAMMVDVVQLEPPPPKIPMSKIEPPRIEPPRIEPPKFKRLAPAPSAVTPSPPPPIIVAASTPILAASTPMAPMAPPRAEDYVPPGPVALPQLDVPPPPAPVVAPVVVPVAAAAPALLPILPPRFDAAYRSNPAPAYPPMSRRLGEQGQVMLRVLVTEAGQAQRVELRASSGSERLDEAATTAVRQWRFVPAKRGECHVADWVLVPINFTLGS